MSEAERPEPKGVYVPPPARPVVTATIDDIAALIGKIASVKDGLASGSMTKSDAAAQLEEIHTEAQGMISDAAQPDLVAAI